MRARSHERYLCLALRERCLSIGVKEDSNLPSVGEEDDPQNHTRVSKASSVRLTPALHSSLCWTQTNLYALRIP